MWLTFPFFTEIVLSRHIPDGSRFLLRFSTKDTSKDGTLSPGSIQSSRPPTSPSEAPSPTQSRKTLRGLNAKQLALLDDFQLPKNPESQGNGKTNGNSKPKQSHSTTDSKQRSLLKEQVIKEESKPDEEVESDLEDEDDDMALHSEDPIEARLRQITELLLSDRNERTRGNSKRRQEKRQVIFVLANYFVLFLSLIAISAEIQARAPNWASILEKQMKDVQNCAANQDALFQCVSNGDVAGLIASVVLWLSRSVAMSRIFLFGFETPKKLWTVVYESLVTAFCWGVSYIFIRRGMNPDTRSRFLQKYWKDAVYGSLAGFNAAFMKQVLKNLIPQEAVEDALRERPLKILNWLPSFSLE